jgi:hypothetical protein
MRLRRGTVRFTLGWSEIDLVQARWQTRERAMICKPAWGAFVTPLMTLIWVPGCLFLLGFVLKPVKRLRGAGSVQ